MQLERTRGGSAEGKRRKRTQRWREVVWSGGGGRVWVEEGGEGGGMQSDAMELVGVLEGGGDEVPDDA